MSAPTVTIIPTSEKLATEPIPFDLNPAAVYLASLSPSSRVTMRQALDLIARLASRGQYDVFQFNWPALRLQHTAAIRSRLAEKYSPATGNRMLTVLRGVLRAARELNMISADHYERAISVRGIRGKRLPAGRALSRAEIGRMLEQCVKEGSPRGLRDAAMIMIMRAGGLRRGEVCLLDVGDYRRETRELKVKGKGNDHRAVPVSRDAAAALDRWLEVRGMEDGPIFCPIGKTGRIATYHRMSTQALYKCITKRGKEAGVSRFSPHDFRRTFVSELLDAGADLVVVMKLAGHSDVRTTAKYDRRGDGGLRRAVSLLDAAQEGTR